MYFSVPTNRWLQCNMRCFLLYFVKVLNSSRGNGLKWAPKPPKTGVDESMPRTPSVEYLGPQFSQLTMPPSIRHNHFILHWNNSMYVHKNTLCKHTSIWYYIMHRLHHCTVYCNRDTNKVLPAKVWTTTLLNMSEWMPLLTFHYL